ncbi:MAG TPA: hypothetical protein VMZ53_23795 [Kofleriaceae bacterium]|nr:hypothetical protein [Kofleriaceae bacterium]
MQDIKLEDLVNVTGGAGVLDNMGTGASNLSNRWANNTANTLGRNSFFGGVGAAAAGFAGGIVGGLQGFGHTLTEKVPLPPK